MNESTHQQETTDALNSQPVGHTLRSARESHGMDITQIVNTLKIKRKYITLMENDAYPDKHIDLYMKGYIRLYTELLGLPSEPIFQKLVQNAYQIKSAPHDNPLHIEHTTHNIKGKHARTKKRIVLLIAAVISICILHAVYHAWSGSRSQWAQTTILSKDITLGLIDSSHHTDEAQHLSNKKAPISPSDQHQALPRYAMNNTAGNTYNTQVHTARKHRPFYNSQLKE